MKTWATLAPPCGKRQAQTCRLTHRMLHQGRCGRRGACMRTHDGRACAKADAPAMLQAGTRAGRLRPARARGRRDPKVGEAAAGGGGEQGARLSRRRQGRPLEARRRAPGWVGRCAADGHVPWTWRTRRERPAGDPNVAWRRRPQPRQLTHGESTNRDAALGKRKATTTSPVLQVVEQARPRVKIDAADCAGGARRATGGRTSSPDNKGCVDGEATPRGSDVAACAHKTQVARAEALPWEEEEPKLARPATRTAASSCGSAPATVRPRVS